MFNRSLFRLLLPSEARLAPVDISTVVVCDIGHQKSIENSAQFSQNGEIICNQCVLQKSHRSQAIEMCIRFAEHIVFPARIRARVHWVGSNRTDGLHHIYYLTRCRLFAAAFFQIRQQNGGGAHGRGHSAVGQTGQFHVPRVCARR